MKVVVVVDGMPITFEEVSGVSNRASDAGKEILVVYGVSKTDKEYSPLALPIAVFQKWDYWRETN